MAGMNVEDAAALVRQRLTNSIDVHRKLLDSACVEQAALVAARMVAAFSAGGKVLFFGNGGSSMDAGHLAAEMLGRYASIGRRCRQPASPTTPRR